MIRHEGLELHPLTPAIITARPDLDPWRRDEGVIEHRDWAVRNGRHVAGPLRLIRSICRPSDDLFYWDGPWGALSGSRGIAIVRDGCVVETFTVVVS